VVIVHHSPGSVKQTIATVPFLGRTFALPDRCPYPECHAVGCLIRWGTYERWVFTADVDYRIRIQRVRCKVCGRTHSLLPDFLHPYRRYVLSLLQYAVFLYLIVGLGWGRLLARIETKKEVKKEVDKPGPARSTIREWIRSFTYGAGELLLDLLTRYLLMLDPLVDLPDTTPPQHFKRISNPRQRHRLRRAHSFWLLAEQFYAMVKGRRPRLHFEAAQLFAFLLHWLQTQAVPPRLFWSPVLATTPSTPF
jgi:hypothetical protein